MGTRWGAGERDAKCAQGKGGAVDWKNPALRCQLFASPFRAMNSGNASFAFAPRITCVV
jgi:hypothetical protein